VPTPTAPAAPAASTPGALPPPVAPAALAAPVAAAAASATACSATASATTHSAAAVAVATAAAGSTSLYLQLKWRSSIHTSVRKSCGGAFGPRKQLAPIDGRKQSADESNSLEDFLEDLPEGTISLQPTTSPTTSAAPTAFTVLQALVNELGKTKGLPRVWVALERSNLAPDPQNLAARQQQPEISESVGTYDQT
jgi:hypothetical protein